MSILPLILLALGHCLVDALALIAQPLWPTLQHKLELSPGSIQWAYVLWTLTTCLSQFLFGYWGDRYRGRWLLWAGPAVAALCVSCIGLADSFGMLCLLLIVGGLGIGAYHPEAAATVGSLHPENRSRAMSLFVMGGSIGTAIGPFYSGRMTTTFGMASLVWTMTWALAIAALVGLGLRGVSAPRPTTAKQASLTRQVRGKEGHVFLVLVIGTLRVLPSLGVLQGLAFMLDIRGFSEGDIGTAQSVYQVSTGAGVLACALWVRGSRERLALCLLPLFATPMLLCGPFVSYTMLLVCLAIAGLVLGGATPVLISYAQALLPEGQRFASSITMGVSWGLGGVLVAGAMAIFDRAGRPELAMIIFGLAPLLSCVLCIWLPRLDEDAKSIEQ